MTAKPGPDLSQRGTLRRVRRRSRSGTVAYSNGQYGGMSISNDVLRGANER